jgi:hypothetical protein
MNSGYEPNTHVGLGYVGEWSQLFPNGAVHSSSTTATAIEKARG